MKDRSFWYLSEVVTRRSSYGWQAKILCKDPFNSSKLLWIVGMMTVASLAEYEDFAGMGSVL